jgi:hypothetical protein
LPGILQQLEIFVDTRRGEIMQHSARSLTLATDATYHVLHFTGKVVISSQ